MSSSDVVVAQSALPTQRLKLSDLAELLNSMLNSVNHGFNHYRPYLRDGSIVKVDRLMTVAGTSEMRNCQNDSHEHDQHQFTVRLKIKLPLGKKMIIVPQCSILFSYVNSQMLTLHTIDSMAPTGFGHQDIKCAVLHWLML
ncbi:hypothetical protein F2Q70_00030754 [Brassica cretica]|uniref:Uncharacterized protein n=1 Tax=Brassica cretica TaxID=69181 RepID=A0A8S9FCF4_BRACR|nr:hypothetical protein F2Q70_00030754 [Brassica cretica]